MNNNDHATGQHVRARGSLSIALAAILALSACSGGDQPPASTTLPPKSSEPQVIVEGRASEPDDSEPLTIRLSQGRAHTEPAPADDLIAGTPLDQTQIDEVLDRLPAWMPPSTDAADTNLPSGLLAPPQPDTRLSTSFPAPDDVEPPAAGSSRSLSVVRYQPQGAVALAPFVSVTFNQPMVPLDTLDQLDEIDPPAEITPDIAGRWRWIGTNTLRFEPDAGVLNRLPAATSYTVTVPAGTTSSTGRRLPKAVSWEFETPAPTPRSVSGLTESTSLSPVIVITFDQMVDPDEVLPSLALVANGKDAALRLATEVEIDADVDARRALDAALADHTVAVTVEAPLPANTALSLSIGPDTPSAEGPLTSPQPTYFNGRTFGEFEVVRSSCDGSTCEPGSMFSIELSNPLDPDAFDSDQISITPELGNLELYLSGAAIMVSGSTTASTTYRVSLSPQLTDIFGQRLATTVTEQFEVGPSRPALASFDHEFITVDPGRDRSALTVHTLNYDSLRVRAWAVDPPAVSGYYELLGSRYEDDEPIEPNWPTIIDEVIKIDGPSDRWVDTSIDLHDAFDQVGSQLVVEVAPPDDVTFTGDDRWRNLPTMVWVQQTTLGVDTILDNDEMVIWTTDLQTGKPISQVSVELIGTGRVATTDDDGLARIEIGEVGVKGLWATHDRQTAFVPADQQDGWTSRPLSEASRWYVFDDRGVYRPGETAHLTGWVRQIGDSASELTIPDTAEVNYVVSNVQGEEVDSGTLTTNPLGGFQLDIQIPDASPLGEMWIELSLPDSSSDDDSFEATYHTIQVEEFRRPDFEVTTRVESRHPHLVSSATTMAVDAAYYAGGPLPGADVSWLVSAQDTHYSPPGWDDYSFGSWNPWWVETSVKDDDASESMSYESFTGRTSATGTHLLDINLEGETDLATLVTAEATVTDIDRQAWSSRRTVVVHPATAYVGVRTNQPYVTSGTPIEVDLVATDIDGAALADIPLTVTSGRVTSVIENGVHTEELVDTSTCAFESTIPRPDEPMRCSFPTPTPGVYRIRAIATDGDEHTSRSDLMVWVAGDEPSPTPTLEQGRVTVVPDQQSYAPGDEAKLLVESPFAPFHGLVTLTSSGVVSSFVIESETTSTVVNVPIDETMLPGVTARVDLIGSINRPTTVATDALSDTQPAFASGQAELKVPATQRSLNVDLTPESDPAAPATTTSVTATVTDADGAPVADAQVAVVVVDEALLSLTGYTLADPLDQLYRQTTTWLSTSLSRQRVQIAGSSPLAIEATKQRGSGIDEIAVGEIAAEGDLVDGGGEMAALSAADADRAAGTTSAINLRSDFDALATYVPDATTNAAGQVTVAVALPDNLTRYRIMAVAVAGPDHIGAGESSLTAQLPLQISPSLPRFLNSGDAPELSFTIHNLTDLDRTVDVILQASNLILLGDAVAPDRAGQSVSVPANGRIEVRFPAQTDQVGTTRLRVVAVSDDDTDAATLELPVYTPATAEAFASVGIVEDQAIVQPISPPSEVYPSFGGLEITTSATALQQLTDALTNVAKGEHQSVDGYASRIVAIASLSDVLAAFADSELPPESELIALANSDIRSLAALQNDDGGFPWWRRDNSSIPWVSIEAVRALVVADAADYQVPDTALAAGLGYLRQIESALKSDLSTAERSSLIAAAISVRRLAGDDTGADSRDLYDRYGDDLDIDALARIWPSITDADIRSSIERLILNRAVESGSSVSFTTDYDEDEQLVTISDRITNAAVLDALLTEMPDSDMIPKIVTGILASSSQGRWENTLEDAAVIVALRHYFDIVEGTPPNFIARAWLDDTALSQQAFAGRSIERHLTSIPMTTLIDDNPEQVVLQADGTGTMYYRIALRYAPENLELSPRRAGFVVDRVYEPIDRPSDVVQLDDGTWRIRSGARVRVTLTMVAESPRSHVSLTDRLPAGFEATNPALVVNAEVPGDEESELVLGWRWTWYQHQNLRDDRVEAITAWLDGGTYDYSYIARATTPGTFMVAPAAAEEIYSPDVFGRSASTKVVIGDIDE